MERPAAGQQREAATGGDVVVLPLDSQQRGRQHARGTGSPDDLVTATGSTLENGAANFFVLHQDPPELAETVSVAFLGMSINCAKCHNHPLEKWTNDQYYGMANLFARVRSKEAAGDGNRIVFPVTSGEWVQPRTGKPQPPRPLDGEPVPMDSEADRREHLADWLTAPENPYFSRAITNRVWANFFGVGPGRERRRPAAHQSAQQCPLLDAAAKYLVEQGYDVKALMRVDFAIRDVCPLQPAAAGEHRRSAILFALLSAADDGRGVCSTRCRKSAARRRISATTPRARGPCNCRMCR